MSAQAMSSFFKGDIERSFTYRGTRGKGRSVSLAAQGDEAVEYVG